jgi:putative transposase
MAMAPPATTLKTGKIIEIIKAHKIRLHPTPEQEAYLRRACGTRRFIYNWGLAEWQRQYQAGEQPSALALKKQFNGLRGVEFPWTYDVTKCVVEGAFDDVGKAFSNFFAKRTEYSQFKKKGKSQESFYLANDHLTVGDHWVQVPVLGDFIVKQREAKGETITKRAQLKRRLGKINLAEKLRFTDKTDKTSKIMGATIRCEAGWWFLSVQVQVQVPQTPLEGPPVGIDLGFMRLATLSDDTRFENQKPLRHLLAQVRYLNQQLARRQKGSKNREKTKRKLARLQYRIRCLRDDLLHKVAHQITERYGFIGLEDLNVRGMFQNRQHALSASDAALGRLAHLIETKAQAHGTPVQRVGRFFPSTKRCHRCHHLREIAEDERVYVCFNPACGWVGDRDLNAALNILEEALRLASVAV